MCWFVLPSLYSVGINALYALMPWVEHGLAAVKLSELFYPGLVLTMGIFFLPSGVVLLHFSLHHVNNNLSAKVVHIMLFGWFYLLNISLAACCGLNCLMGNSGTRYDPGMSNFCVLPLSSWTTHLIVPIFEVYRCPVIPLIGTLTSSGVSIKSDSQLVMEPDARLNMPIRYDLVS
jgi:hypothetical protein